uniref:Uncharacterized protein n=1 Tax=Psilocybe cubensis TaxID=181762 RepID=A0A8H7Y210_PSICU
MDLRTWHAASNIISRSTNTHRRPRVYYKSLPSIRLFLRGIRIGLSDPEWNLRIDEVHPNQTPVSVLPPTPPISDLVLPAKQDPKKPILPRSVNHRNELGTDSDDDESRASGFVVDPTVKVRNWSFHPSDLILQMMLSKYPEAKVAFVDDYIWSQCLKIDKPIDCFQDSNDPLTFRCLQEGFVSDWGALLENLFNSYRIVETDDLVASQFTKPTEVKEIFDRKDSDRKEISWKSTLKDIENQGTPSLGISYRRS